MVKLYEHQERVLNETANLNKVAYYLDMGLGKTYVGSEKLIKLGENKNLLICQKSKIKDWENHFRENYPIVVFDITTKTMLDGFIHMAMSKLTLTRIIGIVNYELAWRRKELLNLTDFTLMLDESSLIQNDKAKQTKFVLKLKPKNVILLSGTPVNGKYENLWTQAHLLGWDIKRTMYDAMYINWTTIYDKSGMPHKIVDKDCPYKNVERLKSKLHEHGAVFMKTEEVLDLPQQNFITLNVPRHAKYSKFLKDSLVTLKDGTEIVGSNLLTKRLGLRQLCSIYNDDRYTTAQDLINSSNDRFIIFYCFNAELERLKKICGDRPISIVNGATKDLTAYENESNSITLIQYQAGAMGLNLQKCNKIIYFSLCERSDLFEQSKKRIHRIGTQQTCFYWVLLCDRTIDCDIYHALQQKQNYTDNLFKKYLTISE